MPSRPTLTAALSAEQDWKPDMGIEHILIVIKWRVQRFESSQATELRANLLHSSLLPAYPLAPSRWSPPSLSLLIHPNPASALHAEAGHRLLEDFASYAQRAKLITSIHATPRSVPIEFAAIAEPAPIEPKQALQPSSLSNTQPALQADLVALGGKKRSGSSGAATPSAEENGTDAREKVVGKKVATGAKKRGLKRL